METAEDLSFVSTLLPLAGIIFIIAIGVVLLTQQFRKNLYLQRLEQEELKNRHQLELLRSSIEVQEAERKRIAQDLHDELGAVLSIVRMHLVQMEKRQGAAENPALLKNVRTLVETSLANMRRISQQLMPPQLETFGLISALEAIARQVNSGGQMELKLSAGEELNDLAWPVKLGLYRICLELINNSIKHSGAGCIEIGFSIEDDCVICNYSDNGRGLSGQGKGTGLGFMNLEGRARSLGGQFELKDSEGKGFAAVVKIPCVA